MSDRKPLSAKASAERKVKLAEREALELEISDLKAKIGSTQDPKKRVEFTRQLANKELELAKIRINRKASGK